MSFWICQIGLPFWNVFLNLPNWIVILECLFEFAKLDCHFGISFWICQIGLSFWNIFLDYKKILSIWKIVKITFVKMESPPKNSKLLNKKRIFFISLTS